MLEGQMLETMIFLLLSDCVIALILEIKVSRIRGSVCFWFLNSGNYFGILGGQKLETIIFFILKDSKIEEITPIFQIEDANSASHPPVVQIEDIHVARAVLQGVSRVSWRLIWWQSSIQVHEKTAKKPREKSIFYSLSIRGVAEVALNQCSWGATYATNTVWGVPGQKCKNTW